MEANLILCTLRHFSAEQSMQRAELVEHFSGSRVVALDIAGDEAGFTLDAHLAAYRYARDRGLLRTAHAVEACETESVWETLRLLAPQRIGYGVRSIEDSELVEHLREQRIHLELCPSSNVQIVPSIPSWDSHPIDRLHRAGVSINSNTNTRMLNPTTLCGEYEGMRRTFGWSEAEFLQTNLMGLEAAYAGRDVKDRIGKQLVEAYGVADGIGGSDV